MPVISTAGLGVDPAGNIERYQPPLVLPEARGAQVGPTPPVAPQPGSIWFDGSALQIWDGAAWHAVGTTGGGVPEPGAAGNFLRTNAGTWVAGVPLTLTGATAIALGTNTLTFTGGGLISTAGNVEIKKANPFLFIDADSISAMGGAIISREDGIARWSLQFGMPDGNRDFSIRKSTPAGVDAGAAIHISRATGAVSLDGPLFISDGTALRPVTMGAPDSGGTGFRQLVVPN